MYLHIFQSFFNNWHKTSKVIHSEVLVLTFREKFTEHFRNLWTLALQRFSVISVFEPYVASSPNSS
jgi:hypothetical protein